MAKAPSLDYNASIPLGESEVQRSPITIEPLKNRDVPPPFVDYVPSKSKLSEEKPVKKNTDPTDVIVQGADYVPADVASEQRDSQDALCKAKAKEMYDAEKTYREAYKKAEDIVRKAAPEDLDDPQDKELIRAIQIVKNKRKPLTAEECIKRARQSLNEYRKTKTD